MQHLGLITILITALAGVLTMRFWPMENRRSYSENIARNRSSRIAFGVYMTIVTLLYYWFVLAWLGPELGMGVWYYALVWLALTLQLTLAWVPATEGRSMFVHNIAAYGVALVMPAVVAVILFTTTVTLSTLQVIAAAMFLLFALVIGGLYMFTPSARKNFLYFQLVYFVAFWIVMLAFTYL